MFLRYSQLIIEGLRLYGEDNVFDQQAWKCARCAWVQRFNIEERMVEEADHDNQEYLTKIYELRKEDGKENGLYLPPIEEWSEDEERRRQLEGLGYIGGR